MPRPRHEPTAQSRSYVESMAAVGIPQDEIAAVMGISDETLRKYYRPELDTAMIKANAQVAMSLHRQAAGAPAQYDSQGNCLREEQKPIPSCTIFWAKTRLGMRETVNHRHAGEQGGAVKHEHRLSPEQLEGLSDAELEKALDGIALLAGTTGDADASDPAGAEPEES